MYLMNLENLAPGYEINEEFRSGMILGMIAANLIQNDIYPELGHNALAYIKAIYVDDSSISVNDDQIEIENEEWIVFIPLTSSNIIEQIIREVK